jgi:hypothetical protein
LSKQHIWPDWLKKVIPRDEDKNTQLLYGYEYFPEDRIAIFPDIKIRQGYIGTRKIRNVCIKCNNGWMSQIEERVRPKITSMIHGDMSTLNASGQKDIASWIIMTSIMAEYTDIKAQAISEEYRETLFKTSNPPDGGWLIWLGKYNSSEWKFRYRHHGGAVATHQEFEELKQKGKIPPNMQSTCFVFGQLFINFISAPKFYIDKYYQDYLESELIEYLICISPNSSLAGTSKQPVNWPPREIINDKLAMKLADRIFL